MHSSLIASPTTLTTTPSSTRGPKKMPKTKGLSGRKRTAASLSSIYITEPLPDDVLLGRGSSHAWRRGNARFHSMLDVYVDEYHETTSNEVKSAIIQKVYEVIRRFGRFLVKNSSGEYYIEIDETDAKRRTGQAMRYRRRRNDNEAVEQKTSATDEAMGQEATVPSIHVQDIPEDVVLAESIHARAIPVQAPSIARQGRAPDRVWPNPELVAAAPRREIEAEELFSDEDLLSVLGHPSEYENKGRIR